MKIDHIAMYVNDPDAARDFFVRYFDGKSNDGYYNEKTGSVVDICLRVC